MNHADKRETSRIFATVTKDVTLPREKRPSLGLAGYSALYKGDTISFASKKQLANFIRFAGDGAVVLTDCYGQPLPAPV